MLLLFTLDPGVYTHYFAWAMPSFDLLDEDEGLMDFVSLEGNILTLGPFSEEEEGPIEIWLGIDEEMEGNYLDTAIWLVKEPEIVQIEEVDQIGDEMGTGSDQLTETTEDTALETTKEDADDEDEGDEELKFLDVQTDFKTFAGDQMEINLEQYIGDTREIVGIYVGGLSDQAYYDKTAQKLTVKPQASSSW